jgi:low affinity Fe/Cu permease
LDIDIKYIRVEQTKQVIMKQKKSPSLKTIIERFSVGAAQISSGTPAFVIACLLVVIWMLTGPFFHFSTTWQLCINSGTSIITFLMVFLIQRSQNKDTLALQIKLNELLASHEDASNRLINIEEMTEDELKAVNQYYSRLAAKTKREHGDLSTNQGSIARDVKPKDINKGQ